jgi:hypothetical protein
MTVKQFQLTIAASTAVVLAGFGGAAVAQSAPPSAPQPEAMPTTPMAPTTLPDATPAAPTESIPMPKTQPAELPKLESIPPTPAEPRVSTTSTPASVTGAAVTTMVLPRETITGVSSVSLPEPLPVRAAYFTLPIDVRVVKDNNIASSTPISDKYTDKASWDVKAWAAAVSSCLQAKPKLVRVVGSEQVPFMLNGTEGTIMLNSSDKAVCPM